VPPLSVALPVKVKDVTLRATAEEKYAGALIEELDELAERQVTFKHSNI
jgi:hypothetical protein